MKLILAILALSFPAAYAQDIQTLHEALYEKKFAFDDTKTWETRNQAFSEYNQLVNRFILKVIEEYLAGNITASDAALAANQHLINQASMSSLTSLSGQSLLLFEYAQQLVQGTPHGINSLITLSGICINKQDTQTLTNRLKHELTRINQWPEHNSYYDQIANVVSLSLVHLDSREKGRDFFRTVERFFEKMQAKDFYSSSLRDAFERYLDRVESFPGNWAPPKRREFEVWLTARAELGPTDVFAHMENRMPETTAMLEANWKAFLKKYSEPVQKPQ